MWKKQVLFVILLVFFTYFGYAGNLSLQENQSENLCNYQFNISINDIYFEDTLYFSFVTNVTNYTIEYWIVNQSNITVKDKYNTTNTNQKRFTPKDNSQNYTIMSNFYKNNCILADSKNVTRNLSLPDNQNLNITNLSNNCTFDIDIKNNISTKTIYYKFRTNQKDYTISYWIEDLKGNIVKDITNTTNANQKQYSPKGLTDLFYVKANLYSATCNVNTSKLAIFYSNDTCQSQIDEIVASYESEDEKTSDKSTINIINEEDIVSNKKTELIYEIYRGNTRKRTAYIYLNGEKIGSVELDKYSKLKGRILLFPKIGENYLTISGLDLDESFNFNYHKSSEKSSSKSANSKFYVKNYSLSSSLVNLVLFSELDNLTALCYVNLGNTKVSNVLNLTNIQNDLKINLSINNSKLLDKQNTGDYTLKLICKYKKLGNKNYQYDSYKFNYTISKERNKIEYQSINSTQFIAKFPQITTYNSIQSTNSPNIIDNNPQIIKSNNEKMKEKSFFFILLASISILSVLVLRW